MQNEIESIYRSGFARPKRFGWAAFSLLLVAMLAAGAIGLSIFGGSSSSQKLHSFSQSDADPSQWYEKGRDFAESKINAVRPVNVEESTIRIKTFPDGASVIAYSLESGEPNADSKIELGVSPCEARIPPGDYLFVAKWPDEQWSEVLRRVPSPTAQIPPSICRFDSFKRRADGSFALAPIKARPFDNSEMVLVNELWVENDTHFSPRQPGISTFSMICQKLEDEGKRIPFHSELKFLHESGSIDVGIPEWTSTVVKRNSLRYTKKNGIKPQMVYCDFAVFAAGQETAPKFRPEHDRSGELVFRGVRSDSPFEIDR